MKTHIPLAFGSLVEIIGTSLALFMIYSAANIQVSSIKLILYLLSIGCLIFFPHSLAHFTVGSLVGIRFKYYQIGRSSIFKLKLPIKVPNIPVLTLVVDHSSLIKVSAGAKAAMYASGVIVSITFPFIVAACAFQQLPLLLWAILFIVSVSNLVFDLYYSPRAGDLSRMRVQAAKKL